jgi:hypothetical protein
VGAHRGLWLRQLLRPHSLGDGVCSSDSSLFGRTGTCTATELTTR